MPSFVVKYVRVVDYLSTRFGRIAMYLIFLMIGTLLLDAVTPQYAEHSLVLVCGTGPVYPWLPTTSWVALIPCSLKAMFVWTCYMTVFRNGTRRVWTVSLPFFLVVYLIALLIGCISSTIYSIETNQRLFSMWNPSVVPIKLIMLFGIFLMLLQALSTFFKDLAKARGLELA